jgi:NAD(P)-dependent dehydrogenase (short-subunit alcohol dehydrogenase family)
VLPVMEAQGSGSIINVSSLASIRWTGYTYSSYYASKAAVNGFTRGIALQYAHVGIRANAILPGLMDTPHIYQTISSYHGSVEDMVAARHAAVPMKRMGDAWDIAHAAVFLASDESRYITGIELSVDGGLHCTAVGGG